MAKNNKNKQKPARPEQGRSFNDLLNIGNFKSRLDLHPDVSHSLAGVVFLAVSIFLILIYFNIAGPVGVYLHDFFRVTFGYGFALLPLTFFAIAIVFFRIHKLNLYFPTIL